MLGRQPATTGLDFWVQALQSGNATYGNVALQIMDGALTNNSAQGLLDQQLVDNRITVATDFTAEVTTQNATADYSGSAAASTARTMLTGITASTSSGTFQSTVDSTVATIVANAPVNNTVAITVDAGSTSNPSVDAAFVSVTICAPSNPSLCQTIDHVLVDTGSYGLRLIYSTLSSQMAAALSAQTNANTLVECTDFIDGYTWGPIRQVNFSIAGETVSNMNIQVIGDPAYSSNSVVPTECSSSGPAENTVDSFGSNGVIGVGLFSNDCGECTTQTVGAYFSCTNLPCTDTIASAAQQVSNPVYQFASDNNGVIVKLPSVSATSPPNTLSGTMVFGINTQSDNALGSASVFQMDENGYFTTVFAGSSMPHSFIDSGSNGLYFPNVTNIATCADDGFYCPRPTVNLSATMQGAPNLVSGVSNTQTVAFSIGYADSVSGAVSVDFGAPNGDNTSFDWGLPFFFGRNVYVAIDGRTAAGQTGPFVAF